MRNPSLTWTNFRFASFKGLEATYEESKPLYFRLRDYTDFVFGSYL